MEISTKLKQFGLIAICALGFSLNVSAQATPELLYYKFDGTGASVPNLATSPPAGTTTAIIEGGLTQGTTSGAGQCKGALIGSGNASSTDYLNTGYAPNLTGSNWTISMWTSNIGPSATLFYIFGDGGSGSFRCFTNGVAGANNWILRGTFTDVYVNGGATVAPHVTTFVYDQAAGFIYGYLDGVLVASVAQAGVSINGPGPLKLMGYNTTVGAPAGGLLDEFRVYNRALSAAEVAELTGPPDTYSTITTAACDNYTVPSGDTTYTVSGTYMDTIPAIEGCADSIITLNLTINPFPVIAVNATDDTLCAGDSLTLSGSGALSYAWAASVPVTDSVAFVPSMTDTYYLTATDMNGCESMDSVEIIVNTLPVVTASAMVSTLCAGDSTILSGSGAVSYSWTGSVTDSISFVPSSTDTYTVTGTDVNGCMNTDMITVTVNTLPMVVANATVTALCEGDSLTFTGSGATSYTWTGGVTDNVSFTPAGTDTYTVTGTDANGCMNTDMITVMVNTNPAVTLTLGSDFVCTYTSSFNLTGEAPAGGTWIGTGVTGVTFDPAVAGAGTYAIDYSYTDANGCSASATDSMTVDLCLGVDAVAQNNFSIYPNPTTGEFTIQFNSMPVSGVQVEVSNSVGQIVNAFQTTSLNQNVDLSKLSNGLYLVKVISDNNVSIHRVVKN